MLVASTLKDLAESTKQIQKDAGQSGWKLSKLEEAMMLVQEDGMMDDEAMIIVSDIFIDK